VTEPQTVTGVATESVDHIMSITDALTGAFNPALPVDRLPASSSIAHANPGDHVRHRPLQAGYDLA
jgi:hypothetical protein